VAPTTRAISFDDLAANMASNEPTAIHGELTLVIEHAAARGATPLLLSILTDEHQADVVRRRAFGRIAGQLAELPRNRV
jgi:hypothetical protein